MSPLIKRCEFRITAAEIIKPDSSFLNIIKRHIYVMKKRGIKRNKNRIIVMYIQPQLSVTDGIPKNIVDSIYLYNDLSLKSNYPPRYLAAVYTYNISSLIPFRYNFKSSYFYKYNNWDIIVVSKLDIKIPGTGKLKEIVLTGDIRAGRNNLVKQLQNNYTIFTFIGNFKYVTEIFTNSISNEDDIKYRLNYFEKSRVMKVSNPCTRRLPDE